MYTNVNKESIVYYSLKIALLNKWKKDIVLNYINHSFT